jgi:hypothetical protein
MRAVNTMRFASTLAPAAVAGLLVAGCGTTEIDHSKAETLIKGSIAKAGNVTAKSVTCPSGVKAKKGGTLTCKITLTDGRTATATVHMTNDSGHIVIGPSDYHLKG